MRGLTAIALLALGAHGWAQVPVPFVSAQDRFVVFHHGRFETLEPRPPRTVFAMEGQVAYQDHEGRLKLFRPEERALRLLEPRTDAVVRATRRRLAWTVGDTLKVMRAGQPQVVSAGVDRFAVSDSLVAFYDSAQHRIAGWWRGETIAVADAEPLGSAALWVLGSEAMAVFSRASRTLIALHRGQAYALCDSTDTGLAVAGEGVLGYWDGGRRTFNALAGGAQHVLSDLRPFSAQAGRGIIAFVDGTARLKCFAEGRVRTVLDHAPTAYWVKDGVLLWVDEGALWCQGPEGKVRVEPYVPEQWAVDGDLLVYLDLNRELRGIRDGHRVRFGNEAAIPRFELFGEQVAYPSPRGVTVVAGTRRSYAF
jgi:hypothetical protein